MGFHIYVRKVETIPPGASVRDCDQLDTETLQYLAELEQEEAPIEVPPRIATAFEGCELIKFTSYLRIRTVRESDSNRST